jgi:hypothetical protein
VLCRVLPIGIYLFDYWRMIDTFSFAYLSIVFVSSTSQILYVFNISNCLILFCYYTCTWSLKEVAVIANFQSLALYVFEFSSPQRHFATFLIILWFIIFPQLNLGNSRYELVSKSK